LSDTRDFFLVIVSIGTVLIIGIPLVRNLLRAIKSKAPSIAQATKKKLEPISEKMAPYTAEAKDVAGRAAPHLRAGTRWLVVRLVLVLAIATAITVTHDLYVK